MPDINELGLPTDDVVEIDYDAPEPGSFPPQLYPGEFVALFKLEDDPFTTVEIAPVEGQPKRKYFQVNHIAVITHQVPSSEDPSLMIDEEVSLRFQRVNAYKHPKMSNSSLGDLIRALNLRFSTTPTPEVIASELRQVDGRATYSCEVGWRAYCKDCEIDISTHARKKKVKSGDAAAWPKGADGQYEPQAACPKCHKKYFGNAEIMRYKLPSETATS